MWTSCFRARSAWSASTRGSNAETASSEAAYPRTLEALERFGVPPRIASFVLPLGYSFNLDGSMMYMTFASIFIAQAYGIDLTLGQEVTMLLVLMITSKGMAGVPRASLVVITATLAMFKIPEAGILDVTESCGKSQASASIWSSRKHF